MARHGSSDDEAAGLPLSEVQADGSRTVVYTGQISLDHLVPLLDRSIENAAVGGPAGIGDEDVDLAKILDHIGDQLLDFRVVADVGLVRLGLDAVLLGELFGVLLAALGPRRVCDGNVGTELCAATGRFCADAGWAGCTGDNDDLALEGEELFERVAFGSWDRHFE